MTQVPGPLRIVTDYRDLEQLVSCVSLKSKSQKLMERKHKQEETREILKKKLEEEERERLQRLRRIYYAQEAKGPLQGKYAETVESHDNHGAKPDSLTLENKPNGDVDIKCYRLEKYAYDLSPVSMREIVKNYYNIKDNVETLNTSISSVTQNSSGQSTSETSPSRKKSSLSSFLKKLQDQKRPIVCATKHNEQNSRLVDTSLEEIRNNGETNHLNPSLPRTTQDNSSSNSAHKELSKKINESLESSHLEDSDDDWGNNYFTEPIFNGDISHCDSAPVTSDSGIVRNKESTNKSTIMSHTSDRDSKETKTMPIKETKNFNKDNLTEQKANSLEKNSVSDEIQKDLTVETRKNGPSDVAALFSGLNLRESDSDWEDVYDDEPPHSKADGPLKGLQQPLQENKRINVWCKDVLPLISDTPRGEHADEIDTNLNLYSKEANNINNLYHNETQSKSNNEWSHVTSETTSNNEWSNVATGTNGSNHVWSDGSVIDKSNACSNIFLMDRSNLQSSTPKQEKDSSTRNFFKRKEVPPPNLVSNQPISQARTHRSSFSSESSAPRRPSYNPYAHRHGHHARLPREQSRVSVWIHHQRYYYANEGPHYQ